MDRTIEAGLRNQYRLASDEDKPFWDCGFVVSEEEDLVREDAARTAVIRGLRRDGPAMQRMNILLERDSATFERVKKFQWFT